jgi:hypothetical protein
MPLLAALVLLAPCPQEGPVALFNGKDLSGWTTWLRESKTEDPKKVFAVHDGMIHVSGEGMGYLATEKVYKDYRLSLEYKWGTRTDGRKYVRNSGVLVHANGPDGGANGTWMTCIECQVAQGCVGDLIGIRGKDAEGKPLPLSFTVDTELGPDKRLRWKKGGTPTAYSGKQFWWSNHDPDFQELLDTRGKNDVESPMGEWTRIEILSEGGRLQVFVNGVQVNEATHVEPPRGKILLQCEGFEIFFRKVELVPLRKPEEKKP